MFIMFWNVLQTLERVSSEDKIEDFIILDFYLSLIILQEIEWLSNNQSGILKHSGACLIYLRARVNELLLGRHSEFDEFKSLEAQ